MFQNGVSPRRVVVTGMGIACPLGVGVGQVWKRMLAGESGISAIQSFDVTALPAKIAGSVPAGSRAEGKLDVNEWIPVKDQKKMDRFIQLALVAATEAVEDSGWLPEDEEGRCATGVMIGSGIGGLPMIYEASQLVAAGKSKRISPFFIPSALINLASGHVGIKYGFKGPNHSVVTACATGVHALGDAARLIALGDAEVMVAGGSEAAVSEIGMAGFCASRALSTAYNDTPAQASRPWDEGRDGFVMGEGAGVVVLEELEHARQRGATIYAEVIGYGMSGDAYHITAPSEDGDADIMLAGGAEATICPIGIAGFAQARALSTAFNDQPEKASRPYDKDRDGFVMGEGAGVVVLEEYEHAKARGAKIYAEVVGYGLSGDAYHVTAPHPEGSGA